MAAHSGRQRYNSYRVNRVLIHPFGTLPEALNLIAIISIKKLALSQLTTDAAG
jgi:hypothetical protein